VTGDEAASSFMSGNSSRVGSTQVKRRTWRLSHGIAVGDEPWTVRELVNVVFLREMNRAGRFGPNDGRHRGLGGADTALAFAELSTASQQRLNQCSVEFSRRGLRGAEPAVY
jgi:hypothetical protein